jgi:hypothetical protein
MTPTRTWGQDTRLSGLRRFAFAITLLNMLGHTVLGFEQSWAQPLVSLAAAYGTELLLECLDAWSTGRAPRFLGGPKLLVNFLLSAHITGLACAMLLYANARLWPVAFAAAAAIASKALFRVRLGGRERHVLNPSNFGITATLLLFHWVGIAPPYMFTENLNGPADWILPGVIVLSGSFLNARFTGRLPLVAAWLAMFVTQALVRSALFGTPAAAGLFPMTGLAFLLFTFYMVTDPATTPDNPRAQVAFGAAVAVTYGVLVWLHVVYGLFFALTIVCTARGLGLWVKSWAASPALVPAAVPHAESHRTPPVLSAAPVESGVGSRGAGECG